MIFSILTDKLAGKKRVIELLLRITRKGGEIDERWTREKAESGNFGLD
jgi:hypothetical protein